MVGEIVTSHGVDWCDSFGPREDVESLTEDSTVSEWPKASVESWTGLTERYATYPPAEAPVVTIFSGLIWCWEAAAAR